MDFLIEGTGGLPNVQIAFPGERWSNSVASGVITPGEAIVPVASAAETPIFRTAEAGDTALSTQLAIAMQPVQPPDPNTGPGALGPNELVNQDIADGDYVMRVYSAAVHLTLVDPRRTYNIGTLLGWDADGERPEGKDGTGSWAPDANADLDGILEVMAVRQYGDSDEPLVTARFVGRSQF